MTMSRRGGSNCLREESMRLALAELRAKAKLTASAIRRAAGGFKIGTHAGRIDFQAFGDVGDRGHRT